MNAMIPSKSPAAADHVANVVNEAEIPVSELVRDAINQAKELTKLEIALARDEMIREVSGLKSGAVMLGAAAALGCVGITLVLATLALLAGPFVALGVGVFILVVAAVVGAVGWARIPKKPMGQTAERLQADVRDLKERMV